MIKVNVGMSRKVSQDFNSTGFSVNLEGEIGAAMDDPEAVIEQIRQYYDLAEEAIQDQIGRYRSDSAIASHDDPPPTAANGNGRNHQPRSQPANGQQNGDAGRSNGNGSNGHSGEVPATQKQIQFLVNLGRRQGLGTPQLQQEIASILGFQVGLYDLTKSQAATVLDAMTQNSTPARRSR